MPAGVLIPLALFAQVLVQGDFRANSGYTFFAPTTSPISYLIDNDGRVVHQWTGNGRAAWVVHLLPNGHILRTGSVASEVFGSSSGSGGRVDEYDWDGSLVWTYTLSNDRYHRHHDIAPLPNGNILLITWEVKSAEEAIAAGRNPARISSGFFWSEAILEVRPVRPEGGEVVWEWHVWDHLVQDFDAAKEYYGDVAAHPELIDVNFGAQSPDWLHLNAIAYNEKLDQIMVSSRVHSELWVIDHSTTTEEAASHTGGRSGRGGDLLYRWGNPRAYRAGGPAAQQLFNQHNAHWVEPGLPGEGNILVFNNGNERGFSTVDEIVPPIDGQGTYKIRDGHAIGPTKAAWSYGENAEPRFLSSTFGGGQRLPNGNTLINVSNEFRLIEVTPEKAVVWNADITELAAIGVSGGSFRATRFPVNYEGLRGTELFREAPALLNAASMRTGPVAPASLVIGTGKALAASEAEAAVRPLPYALSGTRVNVLDSFGQSRLAPLIAVGPDRIDFQIPARTAVGPARVTIRSSGNDEQSADLRIEPVAPALFSASGDGTGVGAILAMRVTAEGQFFEPVFDFDDATQSMGHKLLSVGREGEQVYLLLFGTGIRGPGAITVSIGGYDIPIAGAAPQPDFAGLDQVNIGPLPAGLAGAGEQMVVLAVDGRTANPVSVWFE